MNIYNAAELMLSDESRYRLLVDSITDYAIYMIDRSGHVSSWNAGARRFKGYEAHEITGEHFSKFYTAEDRAAGVPERALETAAREGRFEADGWRVRKDGQRFWANVIIDPIRGPTGEVIGFAKITRDLTERKNARDALQASEEQFRRLVQGVTDYAIFMLNPRGEVSSWNAGAQRIKGSTEKEMVGKHFSLLYTEEDRAAGEPKLALDTAERDGRWEKEGWRVRKDGSQFFAHVIIDAIRDDDGKLLGFAKVTRDITERVQTQRALEQAQRALFQSQKLESLGQVTGGVAHDFNNLLTVIINSVELALGRVKDDNVVVLLQGALHAAERGSSLTQRMLAFARQQELTLASVDLRALMTGMSALLERSLGPQFDIRVRIADDLPEVSADVNQLENAILNLAINARDAMAGGGLIDLEARAQCVDAGNKQNLPGGDYVVLTISDSGVGMSEEVLARAIEPFFTTKGPGQGTGLGLSMVQGLAEQLGGRLFLTSKLGQGTQVALWLPTAVTGSEESVLKQSHEDTRHSVARVLLVDDDELVRSSVASVLESLGYDVVSADSGMAALQIAARDSQFDILVTDQMMPGMTGTQLIAAVRALRPTLPALIITGYVATGTPLPPAASRLAKPFRSAELKKAIGELLRR